MKNQPQDEVEEIDITQALNDQSPLSEEEPSAANQIGAEDIDTEDIEASDAQAADNIEEPTSPDPIEQIIEKEDKKKEDYESKYKRALADFANLEKRIIQERQEMMKIAQGRVIYQLFPVLDNLRQAEIFIKDPGLKIVKDSFIKAFEAMGLKEIELLDKEYDPHTAEVVEVVEGKQDDIVVEVIQPGYEFNGSVLRPAMVKVSKKS